MRASTSSLVPWAEASANWDLKGSATIFIFPAMLPPEPALVSTVTRLEATLRGGGPDVWTP
eukprot:1182476-Prorocentrum_minimum.AAC.1